MHYDKNMLRKNLKNKMYSTRKGYTLLFAVLVSALVLGVAVSILNISRKELILTAGARESEYAFYAADAGYECASYYDTYGGGPGGGTIFASTTPSGTTVSCGIGAGPSYTPASTTLYITSTSNVFDYTFYMPVAAKACAYVDVNKIYNSIGLASTTITSTGYNIGWSGSDCSASNSNPEKVDRAIQVFY